LYKVSDLENALEKFAVPASGEVPPTPFTTDAAVPSPPRKRRMMRIATED